MEIHDTNHTIDPNDKAKIIIIIIIIIIIMGIAIRWDLVI
jgi:hypothetical protein